MRENEADIGIEKTSCRKVLNIAGSSATGGNIETARMPSMSAPAYLSPSRDSA